MADLTPKLAYTVDEAAAAIGISRAQVYRLRRAGKLALFSWAGRTLIRADVLDTYLLSIAPPPRAEPDPPAAPVPVCGVYILMLEGSIAYVGRSTSLRARLSQHRSSGRAFDDVQIIECAPEVAIWLEKELVRTLRPEQNLIRFRRQARAAARRLQRGGLQ